MYDYDAPLDEYDLTAAEGGFWSSLGGAIKGGVTSFVSSGFNPIAAVGGAVRGAIGQGEEEEAVSYGYPMSQPLVQSSGCNPPMVFDPAYGGCVFPSSPGDVSTGGQVPGTYGAAVTGRYGAALIPDTRTGVRRRCPPGAVLGRDNLCYNKRDLRKDERKWNPGRKPLFTGGDLNAITRAHRLEQRAADIARKLGYSVKSKAAAARDSERNKALKRRARGAGGQKHPSVEIEIDN